jgi:HK97 family phage major capsid protein
MSVTAMKDELRSLALKAQEVVDADRPAAEKREELDKIEGDIKALSAKINDEDYLAEQRKRFSDMTAVPPAATDQPTNLAALSIGEQVVNSAEYKRMLDGGVQGRKFASGPIGVKNATITTTASPVVAPQVLPGALPILFNRLTVADLIPQATTNSSVVRSIVETTATNAAAAVAEEGLKSESSLVFDDVDERVAKIATILRASDEMLEDLGWVTGYINGRGVLFVQIEEEDQLLNGDGTPPNLSGILDRTGLVAPNGGGITVDALYEMITSIRSTSFLEPDAIVIHPTDWQALRLAKDANNQYYGGGPFTGAYGNAGGMASDSIWGLRVVVTPAIAVGTALVGAFRTSAQIFRRSGITVDVTNTDGEDFRYNRVAFRFEERLALAVYRPQGFGTVTTAV